MTKRWEKIALACALTLAAGPADAQVVSDRVRAAEAEERKSWPAYRLEKAERGLRSLADRVFMEGKRRAEGYSMCVNIGPDGPLKAGKPLGYRCAEVVGEPGPAGSFRPRSIVLEHQLTEAMPGGGYRNRSWRAEAAFDVDGVRVRFAGTAHRTDGATAPDLDGDPKDEDGWAQALDGMLGAWSADAGKRRFFEPWFQTNEEAR